MGWLGVLDEEYDSKIELTYADGPGKRTEAVVCSGSQATIYDQGWNCMRKVGIAHGCLSGSAQSMFLQGFKMF